MTVRLSEHFTLDEFRCPCCGDVNQQNAKTLATAFEPVRLDFGPMYIVSGFRCPTHNLAVGGVMFSYHLVGLAADIAISGDQDRFQLARALLSHGFNRIGIAAHYVHADLGAAPIDVMWTYD